MNSDSTPQAATVTEPYQYAPHAPGFDQDPSRVYAHLCERDPVHWWEAARMWVVSRMDDVRVVLVDPRFKTDDRLWDHYKPAEDHIAGLYVQHLLDREESHTRVRRIVNPAFTPRAVECMRSKTREIVDELLDARKGDSFDAVADFADMIPGRVLAQLLGVPREREPAFVEFKRGLIVLATGGTYGPVNAFSLGDSISRAVEAVRVGMDLIKGIIETERAGPRGGYLSTLIDVHDEGERLNTDELRTLVMFLLIAGTDTVTLALGFGIRNLLRHPDQRRILDEDHGLLKNAIAELLRFESFGRGGPVRYLADDIVLSGVQLRRGQAVMALVPAANRDPRAFEAPDLLDIRRNTTRAVPFGGGASMCLGASLAKLVLEVALSRLLLERFPRATLAGDPTFTPHPHFRRMASLPLTLGS